MYSFKNDYSEGAHPRIIEALTQTNLIQTDGYGEDPYCEKAAQLIKKRLGNDSVDIHFFVGGTQTNLTALSAFMRPHEAVLSPNSGHINTHETGAIESTGHKVCELMTKDGCLTPQMIEDAVKFHSDEHMVKPAVVYISLTSEIGTLYSKKALTCIYDVCRRLGLYLYIDGARLASALTSSLNDLDFEDLPSLCDAFYIGGTKNGALFGEALVLVNSDLKKDFRYFIKQKGALLAKGRLLGIQFQSLFSDQLFFELGAHANRMAKKMSQAFVDAGIEFLVPPMSNQLFPILSKSLIKRLEQDFGFMFWQSWDDDHDVVRFITSWATPEEAVDSFIKKFSSL